jgi:hypothetical protein
MKGWHGCVHQEVQLSLVHEVLQVWHSSCLQCLLRCCCKADTSWEASQAVTLPRSW